MEDPHSEARAVDQVKTVTCPSCGREVELPPQEPWLIHGSGQHTPQLVSFLCPHCDYEIRVDAWPIKTQNRPTER
jgi:predicted RNA-binding Zn-ribbon protein involved in translation (DUF1610 family)